MDKTTLTFKEIGAMVKKRMNHQAANIELDFKTLMLCQYIS